MIGTRPKTVIALVFPVAAALSTEPLSGQFCTCTELARLEPWWQEQEEQFGSGLAIDDPWFAVGEGTADVSIFFANSGVIRMYLRRDGGTFDLRQTLQPWDAAGGEHLGIGLAMDGVYLVSGAQGDSAPCGGDHCGSGSAYVFRLQNGSDSDPLNDYWVGQAKLVAPDPQPSDWFGNSTGIYGDWIVVGAPIHQCYPGSGSAFIYHREDNGTPNELADDTWPLHAELTSPGIAENPDDHFGAHVAIWDDRVVVGAPSLCGYGTSQDTGKSYVFRRNDGGTPGDVGDDIWNLETTLLPITGDGGEQFGEAVDIENDVIAVGMSGDGTFAPFAGSVYVFRLDDGGTPTQDDDDTWMLETRLASGNYPDVLGTDVAIRGDRVVGGAWHHIEEVYAEGAGFVFRYAGGQWHEEQRLLGSDLVLSGAELGQTVAISGSWIMLGQDSQNSHWGLTEGAYIYQVVEDCNGDCIPDADELAAGAPDCNENGVPDECDLDCNANGIPDECDIAAGTSPDCNANGVPDECDPDCNNNDVPDDCDLIAGTSPDCNLNGLPDECDRDCNGDGLPDECAAICTDHCECNDFSACTLDYCVDGTCVHTDCLYGDVTGSGVVNVFDVFGVLNQIAGADGQSTMHLYDIVPCSGDDTVNVFDALAVLDAIAGIDPCCSVP